MARQGFEFDHSAAFKGLLVASISEAAAQKGPKLSLPAILHSLSRHGPNSHKLPQAALGHAGAELQKAATVVGGLILASVGHLAQHGIKLQKRANLIKHGRLPFHQSFSLPWTHRKDTSKSSRESEALACTLMGRGRDYERQLDVRAAVQCFEEASKLSPTDIAYLCLAAKQWSDLTFYHDVKTNRERQFVNLKAIEYADRAIEAHPKHAGGYMGSCISKGRLALFVDNKSKVKLAKEAREAAKTAITLAPDDDIAHHLMGRWHYEMARINVVVRTVVRVMYGAALEPGTREQALEHYNKAMQIAPNRLVHKVEAGRVLIEMGEHKAAREHLEAALKCDVEDINAWHTRFDAEMLLASLDNRPWKQPNLALPPHLVEASRAQQK